MSDHLTQKSHIIANAKFLYGTRSTYDVLLNQSNAIAKAYLVAYSHEKDDEFKAECKILQPAVGMAELLIELTENAAKLIGNKKEGAKFGGGKCIDKKKEG